MNAKKGTRVEGRKGAEGAADKRAGDHRITSRTRANGRVGGTAACIEGNFLRRRQIQYETVVNGPALFKVPSVDTFTVVMGCGRKNLNRGCVGEWWLRGGVKTNCGMGAVLLVDHATYPTKFPPSAPREGIKTSSHSTSPYRPSSPIPPRFTSLISSITLTKRNLPQ